MDNVNIINLTEEEVKAVQDTLPILAAKDHQITIVQGLLEVCPELESAFSMITEVAQQGRFLINMYKRGVNCLCNHEHKEVFEIFQRHPKYNIKVEHVQNANKVILNIIISNSENVENSELIHKTWTKLQSDLETLMIAAYEANDKKPSKAKLQKYRQRVFRSITMEDIDVVTDAFAIISSTKEQSSSVLARNLSTEKAIVKVFHLHDINIADQADVIFDMIAKAINQLQDIDNLIPWLKNLGLKHSEMNINPRQLALVKPILITFFRECLGFHFTDELKQSWIRIASFIIGMMMDGGRNGGDKQSTCSSLHGDFADDNGDVQTLSDEDVQSTTASWRQVQKVLDMAVKSFYKDLISSKAEIRNLFNAANMETQSMKLVRAIGSTISLLTNLDELVPILEELGRRHVYYNVQPRHFKYLKLAWFRMLENALGLKFTKEIQSSWNRVWRYITTIMKSSLEDALLLYTPPDPEKVKLKILINHIDRIETQHMSYWADIWFAAFTNNNPSQSAAFGAEIYNKMMGEKDKINRENLENNRDAEVEELPSWNLTPLNGMEFKQIYRDNNDPWCRKYPSSDSSTKKDEWYLRGNIRGTFSQKFDLHSFPIDTHVLRTKFALQIDESIATFDDDNLRVRLMPFKLDMMGGTEWDLFSPNIYINRESAIAGGSASGKRYAHCIVDIPIARKWRHFLWDTFMPLWLIEIFSFSIYFTEIDPIAKRMGVTAVLFLCLFTFIVTVSESLPPTPYTTLMDKFFHIGKFLLMFQFFAQCIIISFYKEIQSLNLYVGAILFITCLLSNIYLIYKINCCLKLFPKKKKGYQALNQIAKSAAVSMVQSTNVSTNQSIGGQSHVVHFD